LYHKNVARQLCECLYRFVASLICILLLQKKPYLSADESLNHFFE